MSSMPNIIQPAVKQKIDINRLKASKNQKLRKKTSLAKIMWWNKGNSNFLNKMDKIQNMIIKHKPLVFGICEANMGAQCYAPALEIPGFSLERDNLYCSNIRTRTAAYISDKVLYKRRIDLEMKDIPMIWLEIVATKPKSWLLCIGYRQWRTLAVKKKQKKWLYTCPA